MSNVRQMQCVAQWDTPGNAVSSATNRKLYAAANAGFSPQQAGFSHCIVFAK
jgi:hypothetical protein